MARRLDFSWRCPVCKMHQRKEPHRSLREHMEASHGMVWSDEQNKYIKAEQKPIESKGSSA
jgi:hypothetical protein